VQTMVATQDRSDVLEKGTVERMKASPIFANRFPGAIAALEKDFFKADVRRVGPPGTVTRRLETTGPTEITAKVENGRPRSRYSFILTTSPGALVTISGDPLSSDWSNHFSRKDAMQARATKVFRADENGRVEIPSASGHRHLRSDVIRVFDPDGARCLERIEVKFA
jgi:hypothetical protein